MTFKDHFSDIAGSYAAHRPQYPPELAAYLASAAPQRTLAWDAGCGSGQLSTLLGEHFEHVVATDASATQVEQSTPHPRVEYRCAPAERSGLTPGSVDLAVAAQAAHWFDLPAYYAEVKRVARPGGVVALVTYGVVRSDPEVDPLIHHFYYDVVGSYWPAERRHVEDGYRSLAFPFQEFVAPPLEMRAEWSLEGFLGYVGTWSAIQAMEKAIGPAPLEQFRRDLPRRWGNRPTRTIRWPLALRIGRVS